MSDKADISRFLSKRAIAFDESETLRMARKVRELKQSGRKIYNLTLGEPSEGPPEHLLPLFEKVLSESTIHHYPPVDGYEELRECICEKLKRENSLDYTPDEIIVTNGAKQSIANIIMAFVNEGDIVLLISPYWVTYYELLRMVNARPLVVKEEDLKPQVLSKIDFSTVKMIIINSPCNPSGKVFSQRELELFVDIMRKNEHLLLISDEIYEYFIYEGEHISIATYKEIKERIFVVNGISKSFGMTGWRLGYTACASIFKDALRNIQGQFTSGVCAFTQKIASIAISHGKKAIENRLQSYERKRNMVLDILSDIPGIKIFPPDGAFYLFVDISSLLKKRNLSEHQFIDMALERGVGIVGGSSFGAPSCIRISFSPSYKEVKNGVTLLAQLLKEL